MFAMNPMHESEADILRKQLTKSQEQEAELQKRFYASNRAIADLELERDNLLGTLESANAAAKRRGQECDGMREDRELLDWLESNKARVGWAYQDIWVVCDSSQNTIAKHPDSLRQALRLAKQALAARGEQDGR